MGSSRVRVAGGGLTVEGVVMQEVYHRFRLAQAPLGDILQSLRNLNISRGRKLIIRTGEQYYYNLHEALTQYYYNLNTILTITIIFISMQALGYGWVTVTAWVTQQSGRSCGVPIPQTLALSFIPPLSQSVLRSSPHPLF